MSNKSGLVLAISGLLTLYLTGCDVDIGVKKLSECNEGALKCAEITKDGTSYNAIVVCKNGLWTKDGDKETVKCDDKCYANGTEPYCAVCKDGQKKCTGVKNYQVCQNGKYTDFEYSCTFSCAVTDDGAVCTECEVGSEEEYCNPSNNKHWVCNGDGKYESIDAKEGVPCESCNASVGCVLDPESKSGMTCNGPTGIMEACKNNYSCKSDGGCGDCSNGDSKCDKDAKYSCEEGKWVKIEDCLDMDNHIVGCLEGGNECRNCKEGATSCKTDGDNNSKTWICQSNNWIEKESCEDGCNSDGLGCRKKCDSSDECADGRECKGGWCVEKYVTEPECSNDKPCADTNKECSTDGKCVEKKEQCEKEGESKCDGDILMKCEKDGGNWLKTTCGTNEKCSIDSEGNGNCIFDCNKCQFGCKLNKEECADCEDDDQVCVNESNIGKLKTCIGGEFKEDKCSNDAPCKDEESCAECKPGTKLCADKLYKYCNDAGEWVNENCGEGKKCQGNECVVDPCAKCEFGCILGQNVCADCHENDITCDENGNVVFCNNGVSNERNNNQACKDGTGYRCNDGVVEEVGQFWCTGENAYKCDHSSVKTAESYGCNGGFFSHCVAGERKTENKAFGCVDGNIYQCGDSKPTGNTAKCDNGIFYRCEQNELKESGNSGCNGNRATTCSISGNITMEYGCDSQGIFSCVNGEKKNTDKTFWKDGIDFYKCNDSGEYQHINSNCPDGVNEETGECVIKSDKCTNEILNGYCEGNTYVKCPSGESIECPYKCNDDVGCIVPEEGSDCSDFIGSQYYSGGHSSNMFICVEKKQWSCVEDPSSATKIWELDNCCSECSNNDCTRESGLKSYCDNFDHIVYCNGKWLSWIDACSNDNCSMVTDDSAGCSYMSN